MLGLGLGLRLRLKPMPLRLYNTLTRSVEPFEPIDGKTVRIYTCGPTVYNPAHIGNFRTFLFEDLLRRVLRMHGWDVMQVMNLTDVDDKIIKRASEQKKTITQVTEPVTETFHQDRKYLRIEDAEVYPTATGHIPEMIALVEQLLEKGIAYKADDGSVYFAIARNTPNRRPPCTRFLSRAAAPPARSSRGCAPSRSDTPRHPRCADTSDPDGRFR